ncbi:MAG TPA: mycofactocin system FadH/OYE family oxidoreductase 1 [Acidimicrobiales bacterium]
MKLLEPIALGPRTARNRLMFGPHVTNLGDGRALSARHIAYYRRRAVGGCGVIVLEDASVHDSDWPYERAPLATQCAEGWAAVSAALHAEGALTIAGLGHAGGQGSSAYSQRALWAPSRVPEVNTREVPKWMEADDIAAVVAGFGASAKLAAEAGCDGVEVNAGQHSLVRQFLSGLTNHRGDEWGTDRTRFAREVLAAVRDAVGHDRIVGLRLSCDELAPWAGITPDQALAIVPTLADWVDYVVVVRGAIYSAEKTRPDFHEPEGFNRDLCGAVRQVLPPGVVAVLQGSIVDPAMAEAALADGLADLVEMTRAQIADPDLAAKLASPDGPAPRPCILCNQACQVRDARNPIVSCVVEPSSGHESNDPIWDVPTHHPQRILVVGGGPAGLECARVAATRGHPVRLVEQSGHLGGVAATAGPGRSFVQWLARECERLGVELVTGVEVTADDLPGDADVVVLATGGRRGSPPYEVAEGVEVLDVLDVLGGHAMLPREGTIVVLDPTGGPAGVSFAESLGERAVLVTPDQIAGNELSRTGDLAPANVRLQRRKVRIERRTVVRAVRDGEVEVEDRFTGARRTIGAAAVVDAGFRLPQDSLHEATGGRWLRAGDCVAPRTILEAVLEGRRAALAVDARR